MKWFRYLTIGEVIQINLSLQDEGFDELFGVRDLGLIEAAVMRPQQTFDGHDLYPDIHSKAAALFHSLARTQGFANGNKRTALLAMAMFYRRNGCRLTMPDVDAVASPLTLAKACLMSLPSPAS